MSFFLILIAIGLGYVAYRAWRAYETRLRLLATPLSDDQRASLARNVPLARRLPNPMHPAYEGKINRFLHQVDFIGCDGLEVTEEMKLSIAAQACLLVANTSAWFNTLRTILVYPGAFTSLNQRHEGFVVHEKKTIRLGESWSRGPVVLSWAHSAERAANDTDGRNVVIHEFAHQIDDLSGQTNGVPLLSRGQSFAEWERVILAAYDDHVRNVETGRSTLIDAYGAENHQEFFAVAVETFFERAVDLQREEPELYEQLALLFKLDPASWR